MKRSLVRVTAVINAIACSFCITTDSAAGGVSVGAPTVTGMSTLPASGLNMGEAISGASRIASGASPAQATQGTAKGRAISKDKLMVTDQLIKKAC
jgi:hypothetical protein